MKSILKGFIVEERTLLAAETFTLPAEKHSLVFNWMEHANDKGLLLSLSPAHDPATLSFNSPTTIFGIYLDNTFVNAVLETENFLLTQQSNIHDPFLLEVATKLGTICTGDAFGEKI